MRRREFTIGFLLASAAQSVRAQERVKQHRIAIVASRPVALIDDPGNLFFGAFFEELRRLGNIEGQNLTSSGIPAGGVPRAMPISLTKS